MLVDLIQKHIEKGSSIFSDGWSAYYNLNDRGYDRFTVLHKFSFRKMCVHKLTNEQKVVNTNRMIKMM